MFKMNGVFKTILDLCFVCYLRKTLYLNCDFDFCNWDFISENCKFVSPLQPYLFSNCVFISLNCVFFCHNFDLLFHTCYFICHSSDLISYNCNFVSQLWLSFLVITSLYLTIVTHIFFVIVSLYLKICNLNFHNCNFISTTPTSYLTIVTLFLLNANISPLQLYYNYYYSHLIYCNCNI